MSFPCRNWQSFLGLLRYALGSQTDIPDVQPEEWKDIWNMSEQQAVMGILFNGIEKLRNEGKSITIPKDILLRWIFVAEQIRQQNVLLNQRCVEVTAQLQRNGFNSCILKGQGNATLYDVRCKKEDGRCLALLRQPGDIDVWVISKSDVRCKREDVKRIIRYARAKNPNGKACYHHVDFGDFKGVEVEIHYRPSLMYNPVHNRRLQRWFCKMADGGCVMAELPDGTGAISIPNREFNIIFQLSHIYNHLLHEGIGLRQIIDYYYVLKSNTNCTNNTNYQDTLRFFGLEKIAGAVMWVLNEVLGLSKDYLIAPKDERLGRVLLEEILRGGNFGQYDDENIQADSQLKKNWQRIKRDARMVRYFPSECLWEPLFRIYHFLWRKWYN